MQRWADMLEERSKARLPAAVHRYIQQGARDGVSAAEATAAWHRFRFVPAVLRDVTSVDTSTTLLGTEVSTPFGVAPTTLQRAAHPDGEMAMAQAARASGSLMVVSSNAGTTFEEIGGTQVPWWLQMYVPSDRLTCRPLLDRAVEAGARAVVLTADTPVVGTKYDGEGPTVWDLAHPGWLRRNFSGGAATSTGDEKATDLGPQDVDWLAKATGLPVVVKGVLRPADARRCVDAGAAAIWVSNHGGRQMDRVVPTADALGPVTEAVRGDAEVYVDGGVRTAYDALAALALGARGVFLGRPPLYALAVEGPAGVTRLLDELREDLEEALRLAGCASVDAVGPDLLA